MTRPWSADLSILRPFGTLIRIEFNINRVNGILSNNAYLA